MATCESLLTSDEASLLASALPHLTERELSRVQAILNPTRNPAASAAEFRACLLVDCDGKDSIFRSVMDDWQRADFEAMDPGWEAVAGIEAAGAPKFRAYLERPRGHSKTTDIAVMVSFVLFASRKMLSGVAAAGDIDQARLIRNAIAKLVKANAWLAQTIAIQNYRVVNKQTGSVLDIISNDAGSSYGFTPDFVIVDEVTHWKKRDLWDSLFSSAAKRARCMLVIIANAGFGQGTSWQWDLREACRVDPVWYFHRLDGPQASWINEQNLAEQKRMMPIQQYRRLWLNQWTPETGEGLEYNDIMACCRLEGKQEPRPGNVYLAGLDLGVKNDHSALVVLGIELPSKRIYLADCRSWAPDETGQVDLPAVRQAVIDAHSEYQLGAVIFDPSQALLMAQDLTRMTANMRATGPNTRLLLVEHPFTPLNTSRMAQVLLQVFRNRQIDLYPEPKLIEDLIRLQIIEKQSGFKLAAVSDEKGHADRAIAMAMALPWAMDWADELVAPPMNDGLGDRLT